MTEAEKKEIVALVMSEISGQAVDFDLQTVTPQRTDILPAVRPDGAGGYTGVTLDWGGITDELTTQAKEFRNEALQAKKDTELLKGETNVIKSDVEDIYRQFNEAVDKTIESVRNVYQSDLNAESTARQTADNTLQQNIDSEASTRAEADTAIGARIDSETTTRESEVAELERVNAIQKYEIENLKAKAEGQIYREEIVDGEAYTLDVPSSVSPYAEVQKIGGKSVVWNQLVVNGNFEDTSNWIKGYTINFTVNNNVANLISKEMFGSIKTNITNILKGHKILLTFSYMGNDVNWYYYGDNKVLSISKSTILPKTEWYDYSAIFTVSNEYDMNYLIFQCDSSGEHTLYLKKVQIIDLTQMFGSGNEPTLEECNKILSEDYYPYDAGTLKSFPVKNVKSLKADGTIIDTLDLSSVTTGMKSAGSVADEWKNGKVTKRIGSVDLGTLSWNYYNNVFYADISDKKRRLGTYIGSKSILLCAKYTAINANSGMTCENGQMYEYAHDSNPLRIVIKNDAYTDVSSFKSAMSGVMLYYELAEPTEETIPEIDNYLEVEGGGSLTFESDDTIHMPVSSMTRFVVDLT